jgi:hypothetical protein
VSLYTCGPTVYNFAHIGNLRTYVLEDCVKRALEAGGYRVNHVMNITDVGHLESDADEGDDKMSLAAKREHRSPWEIARAYEDAFFEDCRKLGILRPTVVCRATEHIDDMIEFIRCIERNGFVYEEGGNVYFAIDKFPDYAKLGRLDLENLRAGARIDVDARKGNPLDFVLWFSKSKFPNQIMQWDSPWGRGFPGWHIECSAMATKYLGERIRHPHGGHRSHPGAPHQRAGAVGSLPAASVGELLVALRLPGAEGRQDVEVGRHVPAAGDARREADRSDSLPLLLHGRALRSSLTSPGMRSRPRSSAFENLKNRVIRLEGAVPRAPRRRRRTRRSRDATSGVMESHQAISTCRCAGVCREMASDTEMTRPRQY